jgi:hypothetical protein
MSRARMRWRSLRSRSPRHRSRRTSR